jgi:TolB protein
MKRLSLLIISLLVLLAACQQADKQQQNEAPETSLTPPGDSLLYPGEKHLRNIRQLTFGGDNAEAYFSFDDQMVVMQRAHAEEGIPCDQIFWGKLPQSPEDDFQLQRVSNGKGRTTCSYFMPGDSLIIYASTHLGGEACPPEPDRSKIRKYVWSIYDSYEIFVADKEGNQVAQLTDNDAYDAEATLSPQGDKIVFTSTRDGDLDLYTMDVDGSNVQRVTDSLGYDGGAFFSPDGSKLVFRSSRPRTPEAQQEYREFLARGLVAPTNMEIYVCNVDGSDLKKITSLGNANWAPFFHPSGEKIIFSSNHASGGRTFNLYMINLDGSGLEQITYDTVFDAFPMFSFDGKKLLFSSNRNNGGTRETNVFIADWVE